jgi:hypothetical protein
MRRIYQMTLVAAVTAFATHASAQSILHDSRYEMVTTYQDQNVDFGVSTRRFRHQPGWSNYGNPHEPGWQNYGTRRPSGQVIILDKQRRALTVELAPRPSQIVGGFFGALARGMRRMGTLPMARRDKLQVSRHRSQRFEILAYLRANGFKTFIVSGGGIEFMRPWTEQIYGVPPEQVVGSSIKTRFQMRRDIPELFRLPEVNFVDDGPGKPVGINEHIGRRPIAAFGNSDGDLEMLQWATKTGGRRLGLIVHHTDGEREYAYDRESHIGHLDKALDAATLNDWTVASMKDGWKRIFAFN